MFLPSRKLSLFIFLLPIIGLIGCNKHIEQRSGQNKNTASTPFHLPAAAYLALAKNQPEQEQQAMVIMAAGRNIYDGQLQEATDLLSQTNPLSVSIHDEKIILLAKIYSLKSQANEAISTLSQVTEYQSLTPFYKTAYHEVLALAYHHAGKITESINERIRLEHLIDDEDALENNRRSLWVSVTSLPEAELNTLALEAAEDTELQGWVNLALLPKVATEDNKALIAGIEQWRQAFPMHPANHLLPTADALSSFWQGSPHHMALLLPLTGPLAGPGNAVKDGFMAAHVTHHASERVSIKSYDTAQIDAAILYQQALDEGADFIVGPLTKNDVAKVAALAHPVPTVLLNDNLTQSANLFNLGLSPANEARFIAQKAKQRGLHKALIIAPFGVWGEDIVTAFKNEWENTGATVAETLVYNDHEDLNPLIRSFLHVSIKDAKDKQYKPSDKAHYQSMESKRRQDFDMIFLLAYPSKARQIMPMLKYYFAGNVPVYATSAIYSGSPNKRDDRDLEGIVFCDMPWIFTHQMENKHWPEAFNSYSRLYALGMDSYALSIQLNQLQLVPTLSPSQVTNRALAFGQFKNGVAEKINETL